jgi:hypothetical protein
VLTFGEPNPKNKFLIFNRTSTMKASDFFVFCNLFSELHFKAFNEPLGHLPHGKAQALSWMIYDSTGETISYKSLSNFATAVLTNSPERVNPNDFTLAIFVKFICPSFGHNTKGGIAWFLYRSRFLENATKGQNNTLPVPETSTI